MGRALAAAFLAAGVTTTVWNRTPGRDQELVARGAVGAGSAEEAFAASQLVVMCVVNYDAADSVLRRPEVTAALRGRTLINLSADVPDLAREAAAWAAEHGVHYLEGAIMTPAPTIGTPDAVFLHSGPAGAVRRAQAGPGRAGRHPQPPRRGHRPGGHVRHRAAGHLVDRDDRLHARPLALARAEGISGQELAPFAKGIGAILPPTFDDAAVGADNGTYVAKVNPLTSAASTMAHIVHASEAHGIDASLMRAAEGLTRRAIGLGHGGDELSRLAELLGRPG